MMKTPSLFALAALLPVVIGPLPAEAAALTVEMCGGGTIEIPLEKPGESDHDPCASKGCHAGSCRKRGDTMGLDLA